MNLCIKMSSIYNSPAEMNTRSDFYPKRSYYEHIRGNNTFTEIVNILSKLPSPKSQLLTTLASNLELRPNYIRMVLCPTNSGKELGIEAKNKIAHILQETVDVLFPTNRGSVGSLIHLYANLPTVSLEYLNFLDDIRLETGADRRTVTKWASGKHRPSKYRQRILAEMLNSSPSILFP